MAGHSESSGKKVALVLPFGVLACALILTGGGALAVSRLWSGLPQSQAASVNQARLQARWTALIRSSSQAAREGSVLWEASRELNSALVPTSLRAPEIGPRLRDAMSAPSTHVGRILIAAALIAQAESDGRSAEQVWTPIKPYIESGPTAPLSHFSDAYTKALVQLYRDESLREGTAAAVATIGPEAYSTLIQYLIPRLKGLADSRAAAGDSGAAETCRKTVRRLLREWTLEPGRAGTRLVAADLLARELAADGNNGKLVESLRSWRKAYRDAARERGQAALSLSSDPNLCPSEHAGLVGSIVGSIWLSIATALSGIAALALIWAVFRVPRVLQSWRMLAIGGLSAIAIIASAGIVIRSAGPAVAYDLRGLMDRAARDRPVGSKRSESWHSCYRAQLPWAAAGWTFVVLVITAGAGAALSRGNSLAGAGAALLIAWFLIAITWTAQAGWGIARLNRFESALADAYRKGVFAAVAGDSAENLLKPVRDWQP